MGCIGPYYPPAGVYREARAEVTERLRPILREVVRDVLRKRFP